MTLRSLSVRPNSSFSPKGTEGILSSEVHGTAVRISSYHYVRLRFVIFGAAIYPSHPKHVTLTSATSTYPPPPPHPAPLTLTSAILLAALSLTSSSALCCSLPVLGNRVLSPAARCPDHSAAPPPRVTSRACTGVIRTEKRPRRVQLFSAGWVYRRRPSSATVASSALHSSTSRPN